MLGLVGVDGVVRALRAGDKMSFGQKLEGQGKYSGMRALHGVGLNVLVGLDEQELMAAFERQRREKLLEGGVLSAGLLVLTGLLWLWSWQGARTAPACAARRRPMRRHRPPAWMPSS
jgi:hypothetical protein